MDEIELECPNCGALIGYDDVQEVERDENSAGCPDCGEASPTDEWFA